MLQEHRENQNRHPEVVTDFFTLLCFSYLRFFCFIYLLNEVNHFPTSLFYAICFPILLKHFFFPQITSSYIHFLCEPLGLIRFPCINMGWIFVYQHKGKLLMAMSLANITCLITHELSSSWGVVSPPKAFVHLSLSVDGSNLVQILWRYVKLQ